MTRATSVSARVYTVDDPLIARLPQPEMPVTRLHAQCSATDLADVAGVPSAVGVRPRAGHADVAPFELEGLFFELIERFDERLHVDARPHRMRGIGIEGTEGLLISIQRQRNRACVRRQAWRRRRRRDRRAIHG